MRFRPLPRPRHPRGVVSNVSCQKAAFRRPETTLTNLGNASKTCASIPQDTVERNRRDLVVFYQGCWHFTDFRTTKERWPVDLGSVLVQMVFLFPASKISDKSKTGREKHVSVPTESSHFLPFKFFLYQQGQNVTCFGKDVTKTWQVEKKISCGRRQRRSRIHFTSLSTLPPPTSHLLSSFFCCVGEPIWDPGVFTIIIIFFPYWWLSYNKLFCLCARASHSSQKCDRCDALHFFWYL